MKKNKNKFLTEKEVKRLEAKIYRETHREELKARQRAWYAVPENRKKVREYQREHYLANKEEMSRRQKIYRQNNKEKISAYHSNYYQAHRERRLECSRRWYAENRAHSLDQKKEYRIENLGRRSNKIKACAMIYREAADAIRAKLLRETA